MDLHARTEIATTTLSRAHDESSNAYMIFLDADLIFLDFDMNLDSIVREYSWADMIISKDSEPKNGIINSGFIISRSCAWSRQFLNRWWGTSDIREMATDQHAFSTIWMENREELEKHIALLEPDAINSDFPAWKNQKSHNPVLHLAGGSSVFRIIVFKAGFENVCKAIYRKLSTIAVESDIEVMRNDANQISKIHLVASDLPPQLGLDVDFISGVERNLPLRVMIDDLVKDIAIDFCSIDDLKRSARLEKVEDFRKKIRNIFQRGQGATMSAFQREELTGIVAAVRLIFLKLAKEAESLSTSLVDKHRDWARFVLLQDFISSGFELAVKISELTHFEVIDITSRESMMKATISDHMNVYNLHSYCNIVNNNNRNDLSADPTGYVTDGNWNITFGGKFELLFIMNKLTEYVLEAMETVKVLKPDDYKKLLYFKFKHLSFLSDAFVSAGLQWRHEDHGFVDMDIDMLKSVKEYGIKALCSRHYDNYEASYEDVNNVNVYNLDILRSPPSICFLEKAIEVWEEMHALKFYGYGRGIQYADPYSEGIDIMDRVATFYCLDGQIGNKCMYALRLFGRAVELSQEIWGPGGSKAPDAVLKAMEEMHKRAYYCYRMQYQHYQGAGHGDKLPSRLLTFLKLNEGEFHDFYPSGAFSTSPDTTEILHQERAHGIQYSEKRVFKRKKR